MMNIVKIAYIAIYFTLYYFVSRPDWKDALLLAYDRKAHSHDTAYTEFSREGDISPT